jgi:hypothetical protein
MDKHDFLKEHYFFEINRRHQLTSALSIPIGIVALLGGVLAYFLQNIKPSLSWPHIAMIVLLVFALYFVGRTAYFLIRSYHNYTYGYVATPKQFLEYHQQLVEYYRAIGSDPVEADNELEKQINEQYAQYATQNTQNNDSKSEYLHRANSSLIYSLILVLACALPYLFLSLTGNGRVQQIEVVGLEKLMEKGETTMSNKKPPQPPIEKPKPPPGREFREGVQPPRPPSPPAPVKKHE